MTKISRFLCFELWDTLYLSANLSFFSLLLLLKFVDERMAQKKRALAFARAQNKVRWWASTNKVPNHRLGWILAVESWGKKFAAMSGAEAALKTIFEESERLSCSSLKDARSPELHAQKYFHCFGIKSFPHLFTSHLPLRTKSQHNMRTLLYWFHNKEAIETHKSLLPLLQFEGKFGKKVAKKIKTRIDQRSAALKAN